MKVKELISLLRKEDPDLEVEFVASLIEHTCDKDDYCYCRSEDTHFYINAVAISTEYDKAGKRHRTTKICIQGDRV